MRATFRLARQCALTAFIACGCAAQAVAAQPADVKDPWIRAPAPGQKVAGAYMELVSRANNYLVSVSSPVAARVELHTTTMEEGVMKMRPAGRIELRAGRPVKLEPGGLHIMLIDLKQPLKPGDKVPLTLTVQREDLGSRAIFTVQAEVRTLTASTHNH